MVSHVEIEHCRLCHSDKLLQVIGLGNMALTGIFPTLDDADSVPTGPVALMRCAQCGLVQLKQTYELSLMYGDHYGYHSSLNGSMARHLCATVDYLQDMVPLRYADAVIDIGSNDGTLLNYYSNDFLKTGIDPTIRKFKRMYDHGITTIPRFFHANVYDGKRAKIITSIAMFYDVGDPIAFAQDVYACLDDEGIWYTEQAYLPRMLEMGALDTICQEHLMFYCVCDIQRIAKASGFKIVDVRFNDVNGGSFGVALAKVGSAHATYDKLEQVLASEEHLMHVDTYNTFYQKVMENCADLLLLLTQLRSGGKRVLGYGASTKGNVLMQFCGITNKDILAISDVNEDKWGCVTPGTHIPIISPVEADAMDPTHYLVLPWHFRKDILAREGAYMDDGGRFIFPMPKVEVI